MLTDAVVNGDIAHLPEFDVGAASVTQYPSDPSHCLDDLRTISNIVKEHASPGRIVGEKGSVYLLEAAGLEGIAQIVSNTGVALATYGLLKITPDILGAANDCASALLGGRIDRFTSVCFGGECILVPHVVPAPSAPSIRSDLFQITVLPPRPSTVDLVRSDELGFSVVATTPSSGAEALTIPDGTYTACVDSPGTEQFVEPGFVVAASGMPLVATLMPIGSDAGAPAEAGVPDSGVSVGGLDAGSDGDNTTQDASVNNGDETLSTNDAPGDDATTIDSSIDEGGTGGWSADAMNGDGGPPAPPSTRATGTGDPHLRTFDGLCYDCQPQGEETLVVADSGDLEVQMRTEPYNHSNVAVIVAVAARVGTERVAFYVDGTMTRNGMATTFGAGMTSLAGGASLWRMQNEFVLVWPDDSQLRIAPGSAFFGVNVYLADGRRGHVTGLLGNANGQVADDLMTRDGATTLTSPVPFATFYGTYVESWRITQATSLFDYGDAQSTESFTDRSFPHVLQNARSLTAAQVQGATLTCQAAGVTSDWLDACVLDLTVSGGDMRLVDALASAPKVMATSDVLAPCSAGCATGQSCCDGTCTLTTVDNANCGSCGHVCTVSAATCRAGACGCNPPKSTNCSQDAGVPSGCVDLTSDSNNCGKCGALCAGQTPVCSNGSCVSACNTASGQTQCGTQCVTLGNDSNNCGTCGKACAASELCSGGVCTPLSTVSAVGCADGTREAFVNQTNFPAIAACAGGWDGNGRMANYTGVYPAPLRTTNPNCAQNGNSGPNPDGTGCSATDLCSTGWHICAGGEVLASVQSAPNFGTQKDGCVATVWPANSFFAAAIGSTGCSICAEPDGALTGPTCTNSSCIQGCKANPGLTNDLFGCGSEGSPVNSCGDVDKTGGNLCTSLDKGWSCSTDGYRESVNAVHNPSAAGANPGGGVLCCMNL
jgi:hypothetical protein